MRARTRRKLTERKKEIAITEYKNLSVGLLGAPSLLPLFYLRSRQCLADLRNASQFSNGSAAWMKIIPDPTPNVNTNPSFWIARYSDVGKTPARNVAAEFQFQFQFLKKNEFPIFDYKTAPITKAYQPLFGGVGSLSAIIFSVSHEGQGGQDSYPRSTHFASYQRSSQTDDSGSQLSLRPE